MQIRTDKEVVCRPTGRYLRAFQSVSGDLTFVWSQYQYHSSCCAGVPRRDFWSHWRTQALYGFVLVK